MPEMSQFYTTTDHFALIPALMLALFGCAVLLSDFLIGDEPRQRRWLLLFVIVGELFTGIALARQQGAVADQGAILAFHGALTIDAMALFFNWIFLATSVIVTLTSYRFLEIEGEHHGEYYGLVMLAQCGMFFLAAGTELVTLFIGLELMAVSFYVLVGFLREQRRSNEAAVKYLLLGAFSSGFLAYGFSLLYGIARSTKFADIAMALQGRSPFDPIVFLAVATTGVGLLFKISAAPFHMWAPDAYEGAPTTVTAYLSVGSKAASFAFLLRIFNGPLASLRPAWEPVLIAVVILTLTVGNFAALSQNNVKRLLAYSAISHAGYMLLGLIANNDTGTQGIAVYILVYTFMTLGAFLVLVALRRNNILGEDMDDLNGLMHKSPGYAILMLIFLLSLAGIPPTAGFLGKYYIFLALIQSGKYALAIVAVAYVAVSAYYYFRIVRNMFVSKGTEETVPLATSFGLQASAALTGIATLAIGIYPEPFLRFARIVTGG